MNKLIPLFIILLSNQLVNDQFLQPRQRMVEQQIQQRGITDERVLSAIMDTPRHLFVLPEYRNLAYADSPLPIGFNQTISQPFIVAYMTELLQVNDNHTVLEIGTGSGYQAAVLALLCEKVFTIEIIPELAIQARGRLEDLNCANVNVKIGDGYVGWPEFAPFDRIIVTAAPEEIPCKLVEQLKPGGRMIIPVGERFQTQELLIITKSSEGIVRQETTLPVRFVPLIQEKELRQ